MLNPGIKGSASVAVTAANADAAAVPLIGELRHRRGGNQPGAGDGAADADKAFAADGAFGEQ